MSIDRARTWALASIAFAVAVGTAVGISIAPYMRWIVRALLGVVGLLALAIGYELLRRERVADIERPLVFPWYEALQDRLDPLRARAPAWLFTWRGAVVVLAPVWLTALALLTLPFVLR